MAKGMNALLKQAQKMQNKLAKLQEGLADETTTGSAGGGMVKVKINGKYEVLSVEISDEVINPEDKEMLQSLMLAATNDALEKIQTIINEETAKISSGFGGMDGLF